MGKAGQDDELALDATMGAEGLETLPSQYSGPLVTSPALPVIDSGDYVIEGEYARGGLGRILEASDVRLQRSVAIKEPLQTSPGSLARFMREALVTARLQHPSIVPVYQAGRWPSGQPFYAMKLVTGRSLKELIAERRKLDKRLALLPNVIAVVDAIAFAHSMGVIHRDLKPANVLVGPFGETVVIDWGLAKDLNADEEDQMSSENAAAAGPPNQLTVAGTILGTPAYMAPEQADGQPVDERADVYSLGALLYHVLSGQPPYGGDGDGEDILAQALAGPPRSLEARQKRVPRDLAAIVHKAMARRPKERYRSAQELAEDLHRFQTGQLVSAQRYSRPMLLVRWLRRHGPVAVAAVLGLIGLMAFETVRFRRVIAERNRAEQQHALAVEQRSMAEARANQLVLVEARAALERDPTATLAWLKKYPLSAAPPGDDGGQEWQAIRALALEARERGVARHVLRYTQATPAYGTFSTDGTRFVSAGPGGTVRLWDLRTGQVLAELPDTETANIEFTADNQQVVLRSRKRGSLVLWDLATKTTRSPPRCQGETRDFHLSNDRKLAAYLCFDGSTYLWDLAHDTLRPLHRLAQGAFDVAFSPQGTQLASSHADGTIREWDLVTGASRILQTSDSHDNWLHYSPDGRWLAAASNSTRRGQVWLWDKQAQRGRTLLSESRRAWIFDFSRDGRWLSVPFDDGTIGLWELPSGRYRVLHGHSGPVNMVAFSESGQELASAGDDGTVRRWRLDATESLVLRGHAAGVTGVHYSPGDRYLASAGFDRTARLWALDEQSSPVALEGHTADIRAVAFSPTGTWLATAGSDATVRLWKHDGSAGPTLRGHTDSVSKLAFSPDGRLLASGGHDRTLRMWDLSDGSGRVVGRHGGMVEDLVFLGGGREVAVAGSDGEVRSWRLDTGESRVLSQHGGPLGTLAVSHDERWLAWAGKAHDVHLHNRTSGHTEVLEGHGAKPSRLAFSPDGARLASADQEGAIWLWELHSGPGRQLFKSHDAIHDLVFSPDARLLAWGGRDNLVHVAPVGGGPEHVLRGHANWVYQLQFAPGGRHLASASLDDSLRLWDIDSGTIVRVFRHHGPLGPLTFSTDGNVLAWTSENTAWSWRIEPDQPPRSAAELPPWLERFTSAAVDTTSTEALIYTP